MKKLLALAALAVLVLAVSASAFTASGRVVYNSNGSGFYNARVSIYNATTGASGATYSDGFGNYSFGGLVTGNQYYLQATGCASHTSYAAAPIFYGGSGGLPTLRMIATGSC